jgi:hypothetical protein
MPDGKLTKNAIALAGEFSVLSQLALRGFDANLTLGNTKGVDILVSDPKSGGMYRVEVKTTTKGPWRSRFWGYHLGWTMNKSHETALDPLLFYCFVKLAPTRDDSTRFFIVPSKVVAKYVTDQHLLWLGANPKSKDTAMRKFRLCVVKGGCPPPTSPASDYEDKWSLLQAGNAKG